MNLNHSASDFDDGTSAQDTREVMQATILVDFMHDRNILPMSQQTIIDQLETALRISTPEPLVSSHIKQPIGPSAIVKIQFRAFAALQPILRELNKLGVVHAEFESSRQGVSEKERVRAAA